MRASSAKPPLAQRVLGTWAVALLLAAGCSEAPPASDPMGAADGGPSSGREDGGGVIGADGGSTTDGAPPGCVPQTCEAQGVGCGPASDGCGGFIECGSCVPPELCGGGGVPSQCGGGHPGCVPITCEGAGKDCGALADGCGRLLDCGRCSVPGEACGGGGVPNECGLTPEDPNDCPALTTCQAQNADCGLIGNGCGGVLDCGTCTSGSCGGGGVPNRCGSPPCNRLTCADYPGVHCGPMADGCGGLTANCGACSAPAICGGGGVPSQCGGGTGGGSANCVGLCPHQVYCPGGATQLTGTVYAPNGTLPLPNAVVYVPNAALPPISSGVSCDRCENEDLGSPLVGTITGHDGRFTLDHVPAGIDFPLVIKIGKWRRVVTISARQPCSTTALTANQTRLPRTQGEGNIPRTAIVTGRVDALECVFRKLGVADSEFTRPSGNGRIHLYRSNGAWADQQLRNTCQTSCVDNDPGNSNCNSTGDVCRAQLARNLYTSQATLDSYDMAVFDCDHPLVDNRGATRDANNLGRIRNHVNGGGRLFLSHYNYDWIHSNAPLSTTAVWNGPFTGGLSDPSRAFVDTSFPRGQQFWEWLQHVGASHPVPGPGGQPQIEIREPRAHAQLIAGSGRQWVHTTQAAHGQGSVQQLSFNTPVGAPDAAVCGRVVYSAFHVVAGVSTDAQWFPNHCNTQPLSPQEMVLAFMLFDLASCVSGDAPPPPPTCTRTTCSAAGAQCGQIPDACGGVLECGPCTAPGTTCGGGGVPNQCGVACHPLSCAARGASCGAIGDGCGGSVDCGACPPGQVCGGGGVPNQCGPGPSCTPTTCAAFGAQCGAIGDGCGGVLDCGPCVPPETCGGGGTPYVCGGRCEPVRCEQVGAACGQVPDGCGGLTECGDCPPDSVCRGGRCENIL